MAGLERGGFDGVQLAEHAVDAIENALALGALESDFAAQGVEFALLLLALGSGGGEIDFEGGAAGFRGGGACLSRGDARLGGSITGFDFAAALALGGDRFDGAEDTLLKSGKGVGGPGGGSGFKILHLQQHTPIFRFRRNHCVGQPRALRATRRRWPLPLVACGVSLRTMKKTEADSLRE